MGDWAVEQGEIELSRQAYREATKLQANNSRARKALGEVEHDGKWMPLEEAMAAQGKQLYGGEWLTPDEIAEREEADSAARRAESLRGFLYKQGFAIVPIAGNFDFLSPEGQGFPRGGFPIQGGG